MKYGDLNAATDPLSPPPQVIFYSHFVSYLFTLLSLTLYFWLVPVSVTAGVIHYGGWWVLSDSLKELKPGWGVWIVSNSVFFSLVLMMVIAEESHMLHGVGVQVMCSYGSSRDMCWVISLSYTSSPSWPACTLALASCWCEPPYPNCRGGAFNSWPCVKSRGFPIQFHPAITPGENEREKLAAGLDFRL